MQEWVLRVAVIPGPAALGMLSPRRPGQQGCESMCVKKPSGSFTNSRICSHGGSLGAAGHGPLTWKHVQHISLGCCRGCDESQETEPRQGPQGLCAVTHLPLREPFTRGINSEDKHERKSQVLKVQEESSRLTHNLTCTARTWSPVSSENESFVPSRTWPSYASTCNRKQPAVHNTRDVLTRDQASILVKKQKRAALIGKIIFEE